MKNGDAEFSTYFSDVAHARMKLGEDRENYRRRALSRLRIYFASRRWPRCVMSGILALTGLAGFFASFLMLRAGLEKMWLRYPLATLAAWLVFLALMRLWAEFERRALPLDGDAATMLDGDDPGDPADGRREGDWSLGDWLDLASHVDAGFVDDEAGCALWLILLVGGTLLVFSIAGVLTILLGAPALVAEVFLDAVLVAALYRRVRHLDRRWWLAGALRRTIGPVACTALALMCAGFAMQIVAPDAKSIGGVWRHLHSERDRGL